MPVLGLTMEEGTVAEWLKAEGDSVAKDEPLLMVEMDKGTVEVPSPAAGILRRIVVQPGTTVPIRTLIAEIGDRNEAATAPAGPSAASPESPGPPAAASPAGAPAPVIEPVQVGIAALSRVRKITAERMAASAQATARVTLFLEADFSEAARFRAQLQPEFARLGTPKLPWDALIAKAAALALVDHSAVAAQWVDGQGLRPSEGAHLGIGVAVTLEPEGLVVPVVKDADARSLRELASDLLALVDKARSGRLSPLEMQGGAFTITNLGAYRVDGFTPIINPPETAILGVGRIADKPVVVQGKIEARTMCTLSLSFDHRVVDGAPAAAFLARLAELLERPYALRGI